MNRYDLDPNHTDLGFTAKHMVFTTVRGRFSEYDGYVEVDGDDYTQAKGEFTLQVASINSGNEKRDDHLRSADFFNAAEFPVLTFRPAGVVAKGADRYVVTGDLTIREVTKPIELDVKVEGRIAKDAFGKERIAVSATGTLNRKDWNLNWNMALETGGFLVSDEIKIEVEAAFVADAQVTAGAAA
ncbi:MAG TPA: YceI family protein [Candidatus Dormibacteraeota bacterium]|jgi:polyisoprenoid-binding protein YceI